MPDAPRIVLVASVTGGAVLESAEQTGLTRAAAAAWKVPAADPADLTAEEREERGEAERGPGTRDRTSRPEDAPPGANGRGGGESRFGRSRRSAWPEGFMLRLSAQKDGLGRVLQHAREMLAEPTVDADSLTAWLGAQKRRRPFAGPMLAVDAFMDGLASEGRGVSGPLRAEQLDLITPARAQEWLSLQVLNNSVEIAIVGPFDMAQAQAMLVETIGTLSARPRAGQGIFAAARLLNRAPGPREMTQELPIEAGTSHVFVAYPGPRMGDLKNVRRLSVAARFVRARAIESLKAADVAFKDVSCLSMPGRVFVDGGLFVLSVRLTGDREAAALAERVLRQVLAEAARTPPTVEEVKAAVEDMAADAQRRIAEPEYWASVLPICTLHGISPDDLARAPHELVRMTPADIRDALRACLVDRDRMVYTAIAKRETTPAPAE